MGWIVPKYKHGSVPRNRLKRRLREVVRVEWLPYLAPCDVVIRALPPAYAQSFDVLRAELVRSLRRLPRRDGPVTESAPAHARDADTDGGAPADAAPGSTPA